MSNRRKEIGEFLKACLGYEGFEILNKAIVRIGPDVVADPMDLYLPLLVVPRSLLAWLMANVRSMKDGEAKDLEIPGTGGAHMNVNKVISDVYKGTIYKGGKEMHRFDRVSLPSLAGHMLTVLELYDDFLPERPADRAEDKARAREPEPALDRVLSGRLGELITRMVLSAQVPAAPAVPPAINITINNGKAGEAPERKEPPSEQKPEPKGVAGTEKAEVPASATTPPPTLPKAPSASVPKASAPKMPAPAKVAPAAPRAPVQPQATTKPAAPKAPAPKASAPKAPMGKSFVLDKDDLDATCPDCGESEFGQDGKYSGCPCFAVMCKSSVRVEDRGGRRLIRFGREWTRENIGAFMAGLYAWRERVR